MFLTGISGAVNWGPSQYKDVVLAYRDTHVKDEIQSRDRLIFNMGIPKPGKMVFILRTLLQSSHGISVVNRISIDSHSTRAANDESTDN